MFLSVKLKFYTGEYMTHKPIGKHVRYVAFRIDCNEYISKDALIKAINRRSKEDGEGSWNEGRPWLIKLEDNIGVLRCSHTSKERTIKLLATIDRLENNLPVTIVPLGTSGTIKKLKKRYFKKA